MKAKWYVHQGRRYLEVIYNSYAKLDLLKQEYVKAGRRTWMNLYEPFRNLWVLTVDIGDSK